MTGPDEKRHLETLHTVFSRLKEYGLKLKREKCTFFADSVSYLESIISVKEVETSLDKINAIQKVKPQTNGRNRTKILLMYYVVYYAKCVPNVCTILAPLYNLLKKMCNFVWDACCEVRHFIKERVC